MGRIFRMMRSGEKDENRTGVESSVRKIAMIVLTFADGVIVASVILANVAGFTTTAAIIVV